MKTLRASVWAATASGHITVATKDLQALIGATASAIARAREGVDLLTTRILGSSKVLEFEEQSVTAFPRPTQAMEARR